MANLLRQVLLYGPVKDLALSCVHVVCVFNEVSEKVRDNLRKQCSSLNTKINQWIEHSDSQYTSHCITMCPGTVLISVFFYPPDIDLKVASKYFASKFSCGSSVTGDDEIVIQGDVKDELFDMLPEKWPDKVNTLGDCVSGRPLSHLC